MEDQERKNKMAYKIKHKKKKEMSEAEILNDIEFRIKHKKPVSDREMRLLAESYEAFGVPYKKRVKLPF